MLVVQKMVAKVSSANLAIKLKQKALRLSQLEQVQLKIKTPMKGVRLSTVNLVVSCMVKSPLAIQSTTFRSNRKFHHAYIYIGRRGIRVGQVPALRNEVVSTEV